MKLIKTDVLVCKRRWALGLAALSDADHETALAAPPDGAEIFIPDNNYPTFAVEPAQ